MKIYFLVIRNIYLIFSVRGGLDCVKSFMLYLFNNVLFDGQDLVWKSLPIMSIGFSESFGVKSTKWPGGYK